MWWVWGKLCQNNLAAEKTEMYLFVFFFLLVIFFLFNNNRNVFSFSSPNCEWIRRWHFSQPELRVSRSIFLLGMLITYLRRPLHYIKKKKMTRILAAHLSLSLHISIHLFLIVPVCFSLSAGTHWVEQHMWHHPTSIISFPFTLAKEEFNAKWCFCTASLLK